MVNGSRPLTRWQASRAAAIALAASPLIRALGSTLRWRVEGMHHYDAIIASGKQPIFAFWHGRILPATLFWRDRGIVVITSENFDGEWIARIIRRFGYRSARGSTSRGGARALVQLRRELASGRPVAFTLDGPRGPARVAQPGAVWLAAATGSPLLPFHIEANRAWTMGSWDRTQIPKPFATVAVAISSPLQVTGTGDDAIEEGRERLTQQLIASERLARERAHLGEPDSSQRE
jgi:lysophospholipid acyltransferase (LPLAT)-like uncharacterized protein